MQAELVDRARRGDREAFSVLAGGAVDRLYAIARMILRDADLAEDATQEALVRAWRDLPTLRDIERFDAWLYRLSPTHAPTSAATADDFAPISPSCPSSRHRPTSSELADRDQLERGSAVSTTRSGRSSP